MKMIPAVPGSDYPITCPDCHEVFNSKTGHGCTAKKSDLKWWYSVEIDNRAIWFGMTNLDADGVRAEMQKRNPLSIIGAIKRGN
jgi:hypothetical protein